MLNERTSSRMGYRPDLPDIRDEPYLFRSTVRKAEGVSVSGLAPSLMVPKFNNQPVIDQGQLGSCVGCSVSILHAFVRGVKPRSALQVYYEARRIIGETEIDEGAYIRDGIKVVAQLGAGRQSWWPYDEKNVFVDPPLKIDRDALKRKIFGYHRIVTGNDMKTCLAAGFPFVIGFTVYNGFMSERTARTGIATWPSSGERPVGGHAVCVFGYDDNFRQSELAKASWTMGWDDRYVPEKVYWVRNSWGNDWGSNGNFVIDQRYLEHSYLADDAWTIRKAT